MEKLMYLLWQDEGHDCQEFTDTFRQQTAPTLKSHGATQLRLTVDDEDVSAASKLRICGVQKPPTAVISFWLNTAINRASCETLISTLCSHFSGYVVTESEPLTNTEHCSKPSERTVGMNQVVLLHKPEKMETLSWLEVWHNSHTQIAIETQSTFGYRQNIVSRKLHPEAMDLDAIVEENFPPEAMSSPQAFFATNDEALLKKRQKEMFESVQRFIDLDKIVCLPMSEYNF